MKELSNLYRGRKTQMVNWIESARGRRQTQIEFEGDQGSKDWTEIEIES